MSAIIQIARKELLSMLYSPVGWVALIIFTIQVIFLVSVRWENFISAFERTGIDIDWYTFSTFANFGLFSRVGALFYLYFPLLTMGLLSKEYSDGGIRLLFSSPVRSHEIILGKYLSIMTYCLLFIGVLALIGLINRLFVVDSIDLPLLMLGLMLTFFTMGVYAAIGLFVSGLTSYPLVAAVGSFGVMYLLNDYLYDVVNNTHPVWMQFFATDWLPLTGKFEHYGGMFHSGVLIYFVLMIGLFLGLAYLRIRFQRTTTRTWIVGLTYSVCVIGVFVIAYLTYNPTAFSYFDWTSKKQYSPSDEQLMYEKMLTDPVSITRYTNILSSTTEANPAGFFGSNRVAERVVKSIHVKTKINYIPYYDHVSVLNYSLMDSDTTSKDAALLLMQTSRNTNRSTEGRDLEELVSIAKERHSWIRNTELLNPDEIADIVPRGHIGRSSFLIESGNKQEWLLRSNGVPSDQAYTTVLKRMVTRPVIIGYFNNYGTRDLLKDSETDYDRFFYRSGENALSALGFDVIKIDPESVIEDSIDILVIADPSNELPGNVIANISNFIEQGGNVFITSSSQNSVTTRTLINKLGLDWKTPSSNHKMAPVLSDVVIDEENPKGFLFNKVLKRKQFASEHQLISPNGEGYDVILGDASTLIEIDSSIPYESRPIVGRDDQNYMYAISRNLLEKQQRIIVSGSADFLNNSTEGIARRSLFGDKLVNFSLGISLFRWLSNDEYPVLVDRPIQQEKLILRDHATLRNSLFIGTITPLFALALFVLNRRRRR